MIEQGLKMGAEVLVLLAMLLHGRHVVLDAEGNLPAAKPKPVVRKPRKTAAIDFQEIADESAKEETAESDSTAGKTPDFRAVDPPHPIPTPLAASLTLGRTGSSSAANSGTPQSQGEKKMSKAEKKALRKRLEDMRHSRGG
jgi:hypothetical protein